MKHILLIIIVVAFTALASLYSVVVPLGEGPDEPGHASYVFFLAREQRLPDQRANEVPGEGHQPPLAYALAAPLVAWLPVEQRGFDLPGNPRFTWAAPVADPEQAREISAVAHGSREHWPWQEFVLAWHLARLVSVALGAATVLFTYLAAKAIDCRLQIADCRLSPEQPQSTMYNLQSAIPLLAAAFVAFNPQFLFVAALITNDALLTALSAALIWLVMRRLTTDDRPSAIGSAVHAVVIGIVLGLALLTKQSAIVLAPVALLSVLKHSWWAGQARRDGEKRRAVSPYHPVFLSHIMLFMVVTLLICGWWYLRNRQLYGDLFGLAVFQREFATEAFDMRSPAAWLGALAQLHASFWARFGWMNVPAPGWVIWVFALVELAALIGLALKGFRTLARWNVGTFEWWPIVALPLLAFGWVISFALTAGLVAWQGRLLFPALPAIAIVLALGLSAWENRESRTENRQRFSRIWFLVLGSWFLVALWLPFGVIRPAYPFHTLPEPVALGRIATPVYGRLGLVGDPGAELRGWRLAGDLRPGSAPKLTLIWHALGRQNRDWTVFVHLVGANEQIVAQGDAQPQAGAFPMKQWVAGDWVEDEHALALPAGVPPGSYTLRVGLFDPRTERRAAVFDHQGELVGDYVDLGYVQIK